MTVEKTRKFAGFIFLIIAALRQKRGAIFAASPQGKKRKKLNSSVGVGWLGAGGG
jgi:hypothetical protein